MATTPMLPEQVFRVLRPGLPAVLITVGEDGWGHAVMAWAVAVAPDCVRFTADHGTRTLANLHRTGKAGLEVIGPDNLLVMIKGHARHVHERIHAAPFGMAMWEMSVTEVKDQAWEGVVVSPITFEWIGPKAADFRRIEQAVLAEMREARSG